MDSSTLSFSPDVISNLVEQINLYGMSVSKFRRMLKLLLADFAFQGSGKDEDAEFSHLTKLKVHEALWEHIEQF
jgi:hypothetical protein